MSHPLTTSQVARTISESPLVAETVHEWQVRRLYEDGTLSEPQRFGGKRMIDPQLIPEILQALYARGWLPSEAPPQSHCIPRSQRVNKEDV